MRMDPVKSRAEDVSKVLAGMVADPVVLGQIVPHWEQGMFRTQEASTIAGWCVEHHRRYGMPPGSEIQSYFSRWAANRDRSQAELVERQLGVVFRQMRQELASDYVLDLAGKEFNRVRLRRLARGIDSDLELDDEGQALARVSEMRRIELGKDSVVDMQDELLWERVFDRQQERDLVRYKRGLAKFFGGMLTRDSLISFMAPDKVGKSFWLLDVAFRGLQQRRKVAYFECGDLGREETMKRFGERASRQPATGGTLQIPQSIHKVADRQVDVKYTTVTYEPLLHGVAKAAFQRECRGQLRLSVHSNDTLSVERIDSLLRSWEYAFVPDVVVIDYADILAPPSGVKDTLDQMDKTWKQLRRLSQDWHCLVVTASQTNAAAYRGGILRKKHFSGRKTKLAHVNGMIGINMLEDHEDKERGISRLNWVVRRRGFFSENVTVDCAGCLAIANPAIRSVFGKV